MYIDINKLQSDRIECSKNLTFLDDIIKNYHYYLQQNQVNNTLAAYQTEYQRNLQALNVIDEQLAQASGPAPIMRQHTGIGNTKSGGVIINKGAGISRPLGALNKQTSAEYSGIKKGSSSDEPAYVEPTYNNAVQTQYEPQNSLPPVVTPMYFLKEKSINIVHKNGKYIGTGLPDTKPIAVHKVDNEFTSTSFLESEENILYVKQEEPIELPPLIGIKNLRDIPFSEINFAALNGKTIDAATMVFFQIRDILIEHVKFIQNDQSLIADNISDITECLSDKDLPSKDLVTFKKIWDNVIIKEVDGKYFLDRGGDYLYFDSQNLDTEMIISYIRENNREPIWLREDAYLGLFEAIKQCKLHGTLELTGKVKFKYYTGKDAIKLIRM